MVFENASHGCGSGADLQSSWQPRGGLVDPFQVVAAQTQPLLSLHRLQHVQTSQALLERALPASPPHYIITSLSTKHIVLAH